MATFSGLGISKTSAQARQRGRPSRVCPRLSPLSGPSVAAAAPPRHNSAMSIVASDRLSAAMSLPESDRASIAYELLHSLKPPGVLSEDDPGLLAELERRSAALDRDPSLGIPLEEADRRIRQILQERRQS